MLFISTPRGSNPMPASITPAPVPATPGSLPPATMGIEVINAAPTPSHAVIWSQLSKARLSLLVLLTAAVGVVVAPADVHTTRAVHKSKPRQSAPARIEQVISASGLL